ncbi:hypothetical protein SAMN02927937_00146 [Paenimyroides aquimaris]|uniref:Uncharacterized protein n=1 Tax=Paenimyroides marinum TaxID=1159016 RepID=A0A1H6IZ04_9FLAO|nr:hypothetical protein [Paenimyroides aquimaris]SEH54949.1 hypothetical protein SAMN02927937_00146 [Paenimyroides aquimaris]
MKKTIIIILTFVSFSFYGKSNDVLLSYFVNHTFAEKSIDSENELTGKEWVEQRKSYLIKKMGLNDTDCEKLFYECTDAFTDIYANSYEKLVKMYKGKEKDEKYHEIYSKLQSSFDIRVLNCTDSFQSCLFINKEI